MCLGTPSGEEDTSKDAAIKLARLMERELGWEDRHIDAIALRLFILAYWNRVSTLAHAIHPPAPEASPKASRPRDFLNWAAETFGPIALDRGERIARFLEEAIELAHAENVGSPLLYKIIDRVYARERGKTFKEVGQAQATLETFAECLGLSADNEAELEWRRVQSIPAEEWRRRHAAKVEIGIAQKP